MGKAKELTISTTPSVKQKYYTYPKDWQAVETKTPFSVPVDQLEYGLCLFIQIENPGVQQALKVQYFYNPKTTSARAGPLITHVVSGQTSGFNTKRINDASDKFATDDPLYLVTVHDLQLDRVWNPKDGDVSKLFISEDIVKLDMCSKRGLCDFDTGMCDCFSGYSGIRCDDQNAIAYSY